MIERIIRGSLAQRGLVLVATVLLTLASLLSVRGLALDAIPDLSDVQVIIRTPAMGQAPQIVEDQITYPITTRMLALPKAKAVRGFSMYGDSFVYVLFEDGTDLYWARSRVLEALSQVRGELPAGVDPVLGPDATGVGWVYQYALVDRSGGHDLAELRSLAGLVPALRAAARARRCRSGQRRWLRRVSTRRWSIRAGCSPTASASTSC